MLALMARMHPDHGQVSQVPETAAELLRPGFLARTPIAGGDRPVDDLPALTRLHPEEVALVLAASPRRARELLAGRIALRQALAAAGWDGGEALLPGEQGRCQLPSGFSGSITHKDGLALAFARRSDDGVTVGVDSEVVGERERARIAARVLVPTERLHWEREQGGSWPALLERFSMKEAIYKALHPHVPRYIAFEEAEISADGTITMSLAQGEGPFQLVGWSAWEGEGAGRRLVSLCGARRL